MNKTSTQRRLHLIAAFLKGQWHLFFFALLLSMGATVFNSLTPQIIRLTVDSVIGNEPLALPGPFLGLKPFFTSGSFAQGISLCAGLVVITAVCAGLCGYVSRMSLAKGSENMLKNLRDRLFEHIQRLPFSWHVKNQTGEIIQRCTSDVNVIRGFISGQMVEVFRTVFLIVLSMSIMFSMNVRISLVALIFIPIVALYSGIFFSIIAKKFLEADVAEGALSTAVQENLTGVRVVRAFGRESFEVERFEKRNRRFADLWIRLGHIQSYYWAIGDLITGLQIMTVAIFGVTEAVNGAISLGEFLAFISYNTTLVWPVRSLGRILSEMSKAGVSIDRVNYILESQEEEDSPAALEPPMDGDIAFRQITFQYEGVQPVLRDIDFTIPAGSTFAILGGTGSGKSTLMHLLTRLYDLPPECGQITIGGIDIAQMKRGWVRKNIGMVLQEPFLFSRTIKENIAAPRPDAPMPEIRRAAGIACVDGAIDSFTDGYDTIVGERGVTLSGGQKQRVAIARMLMQNAPIMIFDDSLSAVDAETDAQIRAALKEQMGRSTVILISHRITTLMQADQILVLEDGRMAELGTHQQLIGRDGVYKQIYDIQMSSDDRALIASPKKEGEEDACH